MNKKDNDSMNETDENIESNALKVLRGTGQSIETEPVSHIGERKIGWLENIWYQHKWHAGIIIAFAVIAVVLVVQLVSHKSPDVYIMYAGPQTIIGNQYDKLEDAFENVMKDYNKDGKKVVSFTDNTILTKAQIDERRKAGLTVDETSNSAAYQRYTMEISAGEHLLCFLDPSLYKEVANAGGFIPLSDIFKEVPLSAVDEYGIRLGDTDFYKTNSEIGFLPPDTVLAVRVPSTLNLKSEKKKKEYSKRHIDMFVSIAEFKEYSE